MYEQRLSSIGAALSMVDPMSSLLEYGRDRIIAAQLALESARNAAADGTGDAAAVEAAELELAQRIRIQDGNLKASQEFRKSAYRIMTGWGRI
jgi:hypothetical protein